MTGPDFESIRAMGEEEFEALMADPAERQAVIDSLIDYFADRFRPENAGEIDATIHVKLWDRPGGGYDHYELRIADRQCKVTHPTADDADLTLKVRPTDLRDLVTGKTGPRRLAMRGRLRVLGDLKLGMRLPDLFELSSP